MDINSKSFDTFEELSKELDLIGFLSAYCDIKSLTIDKSLNFYNIELGGSNDITYDKNKSIFNLQENHTYIILSKYKGKNLPNTINSFVILANNVPISSINKETSLDGTFNCNDYVFYTSSDLTNIEILNLTNDTISDFNCKFLILEID